MKACLAQDLQLSHTGTSCLCLYSFS